MPLRSNKHAIMLQIVPPPSTEKLSRMRGSSFITRLPCKRTFRKPTKWRILSTSCGVMLSNFVKPNPHRLISGAQVTSNIPPVCSDACMAVRKGLHQVIYLTMFFVPSVSLCRIHFYLAKRYMKLILSKILSVSSPTFGLISSAYICIEKIDFVS